MRFLAIICLVGIVLSVAILSKARVEAYNNTCISSNAPPTVAGTPVIPTTAQPSVVLNEVLTNPSSVWNCNSQGLPAALQNQWIEMYNLLNQPLDLYRARTFIDTGPNTSQYYLMIGSVIPSHGFFTFFPYTSNRNFSLPKLSTIRLFVNYVLVDQVTVPPLPGDISYARIPDGTGKWQQSSTPTINSSNSLTSSSSTPTQIHKKRSGRSKTTAQGRKRHTSGNGNSGTTSQTLVNATIDESQRVQNDAGKQTQWPGLQFPSSLASPSALSTSGDRGSTPSPPSPPAENVSQKMLFSLIGIAGLLSIWLGWRRFFKKRARKAKNTFAPR